MLANAKSTRRIQNQRKYAEADFKEKEGILMYISN